MKENKTAGKKGGGIAKNARIELENKTGKKVITSENYLSLSKNKVIREKSNKKS